MSLTEMKGSPAVDNVAQGRKLGHTRLAWRLDHLPLEAVQLLLWYEQGSSAFAGHNLSRWYG